MNNRKELAELIQQWADNPDSYFELNGSKVNILPIPTSDIHDWELIITPKESPLKKYIELRLDMEFNINRVGKLTVILKSAEFQYKKDELTFHSTCRLRPNHVHWWGGKSDINPIPEECEYKVFYTDKREWFEWTKSYNSNITAWKKILAFEIRYL